MSDELLRAVREAALNPKNQPKRVKRKHEPAPTDAGQPGAGEAMSTAWQNTAHHLIARLRNRLRVASGEYMVDIERGDVERAIVLIEKAIASRPVVEAVRRVVNRLQPRLRHGRASQAEIDLEKALDAATRAQESGDD